MFRQVHPSLWREPWFEALSAEGKLVFLFLTTCGDTSPAGFVLQTLPRLAFNVGLSTERLTVALQTLEPKVLNWPEHGLFWIRRFWLWQGKGPKWERAVYLDVQSQAPFAQAAFYAIYPMDTLSIPHAYPSGKGTGTGTGKEQERSTPPLSSLDSAIASPTPKKSTTPKPKPAGLGSDFEQRMLSKYPSLGPDTIHDQIELALSHVNAKKYTNTELYVQNWLRKEAEHAQGNSNRPTGHTRFSTGGRPLSPAHNPPSAYSVAAARAAGAPLSPGYDDLP